MYLVIYFIVLIFSGWLFIIDLSHLLWHVRVHFGVLMMVWIVFSLYVSLVKLRDRYYKGIVTKYGLKTGKIEIPFNEIIKIERFFSLSRVITREKTYSIALSNAALQKLSHVHFLKWVIEGSNFTATEGNGKLSIALKSYGKYRGIIDYFSWYKIGILGGIMGLLFPSCLLFLIFLFLATTQNYKILIDISDDNLHYKDNSVEHFIIFSQIVEIKVKKNVILVTLNDGSVLKFRRVFMLEELLTVHLSASPLKL